MRAERKAELFYSKQAEKASVEDIKRFFEELAKFEKGHFDYLDGIVSTITDTGDFILG
jgi:rubrerythrin